VEAMKHEILIVDDDKISYKYLYEILSGDYTLAHALDGLDAIRKTKEEQPDLILMDVNMPQMDGYETIQLMKADNAISHIPVIFMTGLYKPEGEAHGLSLGAVDYIRKPCDAVLLKKRVELRLIEDERRKALLGYGDTLQQLVKEKTDKIISVWDAVLSTMAEFLEFRDHVTGGHVERTRKYVSLLTEKMLMQRKYVDEPFSLDAEHFGYASQLHDLGKVKIHDNILSKPGKLTVEEFETMKLHAVYGRDAIVDMSKHIINGVGEHLQVAAVIAYSHHERWDGAGYPQGLMGRNIPLPGRLMAIADVYDALISTRPYKKAISHDEAVYTILAGKGTQFDPVLIDIFAEAADEIKGISQTKRV
jgi:putative two-component system response regulator